MGNEAKARGSTVIHVDPRFTRTSAVADLHVPLRAGSDIAFLGGIINYVLSNEAFFHDYVTHYTNAATIVSADFADTEDLDGLFSGWDGEHRSYDPRAWRYEGAEVQAPSGDPDALWEDRAGMASVRQAGRGEAHGSGGAHVNSPLSDPTLRHPRCVFQILRRHFARYTPEMVEQVCGVPAQTFERVCALVAANSGRDRTTAFVYSVGWTQHTVGVLYIRTASILQALLGNMGRPGGGILALRGHASIQGSTDIPTLFNLLPGYIPMPHAHANENLDSFVAAEGTDKGFWAEMRSYLVSLLKAWIIRAKLAGSADAMDRPILDLTWDYPVSGPVGEPSAEAVLAEINGRDSDGAPLSAYTQMPIAAMPASTPADKPGPFRAPRRRRP